MVFFRDFRQEISGFFQKKCEKSWFFFYNIDYE